MSKPVPLTTVFSHPIHFLAFGFGSGLSPKAPGTAGTLAALPLCYLCALLPPTMYWLITALICLTGLYICGESARKLKSHDHPGIVWDEFAGIFITLGGFSLNWTNLVLGFLLFRVFDILKPWPIAWADKKVSGGLGIMLDDIIAGMMAWIVLYGINSLWFDYF